MQNRFISAFVAITCLMALLLLSGCSKHVSSLSRNHVTMTADGERVHLSDGLTAEDFVALAGLVTEKMLDSRIVRKWKKPPFIVVARPENISHEANIITKDLQDEIISRILDAGVARVIDEENLSFRYDYIIKTTITETIQHNMPIPKNNTGTRQLISYICSIRLFSLRGERIGQWQDSIQVVINSVSNR